MGREREEQTMLIVASTCCLQSQSTVHTFHSEQLLLRVSIYVLTFLKSQKRSQFDSLKVPILK